MLPKFVPVGAKFGRWTVLKCFVGKEKRGTSCTYANVRCDCGKERTVRRSDLTSEHTKSCGCITADRLRKHGESGTAMFMVWANIIARCTSPNHKDYSFYGGRGVGICDRWRHDFAAFKSDMGDRPTGGTVERIDNSRGYEPGNCRWATAIQQAANKRPRRRLGGLDA